MYRVWAKCVELPEQRTNSMRVDVCLYPCGFVLPALPYSWFPPLPRTCTQKVPDINPDVLRQAMALGPVGKAELTHQASIYIGKTLLNSLPPPGIINVVENCYALNRRPFLVCPGYLTSGTVSVFGVR